MTAVAAPLRVLVVGSSTTYMVVPARRAPQDGSYPQHLRLGLHERGVPVEVSLLSRWFGRVDEFLSEFQPAIRDRLPDVVVLDLGFAECQSRVLPNVVARHFLTWDRSSHPVALAYRRVVASRLWRVLRALQRRLTGRSPLWLSRLAPGRFVHDTRRLVDLVRTETGAAVVLLGVEVPGSRVEGWMPGIVARAAHYDELLRQLAADLDDPAVTYVSKAADTLLHPPDELLPDGLHRTAAGHRLLAERLVDPVLAAAGRARTGRAPSQETAS